MTTMQINQFQAANQTQQQPQPLIHSPNQIHFNQKFFTGASPHNLQCDEKSLNNQSNVIKIVAGGVSNQNIGSTTGGVFNASPCPPNSGNSNTNSGSSSSISGSHNSNAIKITPGFFKGFTNQDYFSQRDEYSNFPLFDNLNANYQHHNSLSDSASAPWDTHSSAAHDILNQSLEFERKYNLKVNSDDDNDDVDSQVYFNEMFYHHPMKSHFECNEFLLPLHLRQQQQQQQNYYNQEQQFQMRNQQQQQFYQNPHRQPEDDDINPIIVFESYCVPE